MKPKLLLPVVLSLLSLSGAAQEIGTLTLVEGSLQVIRGTAALQGAEGVRLHQGDILKTSDPGFAQLELTGGAIIALGASTRAFLFARLANGTNELVLLSGWLKGETSSHTGAYSYAGPLLAATTREGAVVLHAGLEIGEIFVESGSAGISEVGSDGSLSRPNNAKAGQFFSRPPGKSVAVQSGPSSPFLASIPRPFEDTLPSRLSRFSGKPPAPKFDHEVTYAEIQPWLTARLAWRRSFVKRFEPRLGDAAFRSAVEAHLREHPEWDPVLHPEKHQTKMPPAQVDSRDLQQGGHSQ